MRPPRWVRSPWLAVALSALSAAALTACTLVVGHIHIPSCTPGGTDCDSLNARDGLSATSCPRWFCSAGSRTCVKGTVDADSDGHTDPSCPMGDDCDDTNAMAFPGATETCDGVDENCNGVIDDGVLVDHLGTVTTTMAAPGAGRYAPGSPGRSTATWVEGAGALSTLEHASLQAGTMSPASPVIVQTNNHPSAVIGSDSLASLSADGLTPTTAGSTCMVRNSLGTVACANDANCFQDRGTCIPPDGGVDAAAGSCTGGVPFRTSSSCWVSRPRDAGMPGVDAGTETFPDDTACVRADVCASGFCQLATRDDVGTAPCRFAEAALDDVTGSTSLLAAIDTQGCAAGALRLFAAPADFSRVTAVGPEYRSNVYTGVDTTPTAGFDAGMPDGGIHSAINRCTGLSRTDGILGASRPSLVGLHGATGLAQALVAYQSRPATPGVPPACSATAGAAPVSVLAAFVENAGGLATAQIGITASNGGVPQDLGHTSGVAPIGLAALGGAHYAVAFPDAAMTNTIAVYVLDPATEPAPFTFGGDGGAPLYMPRATGPLTFPASATGRITTGGPADGVVLAPGAPRTGGGQRIGVAWQEGCDASLGGTIKFAVLEWNATGASTATTPITVSTGTASASAPAILYVADGFVRVGATRAGMTATTDTDGGWVIAFQASGGGGRRTYVTRVAELDVTTTLEAPVDVDPASAASAHESSGVYTGSALTRSRAAFAALDSTGTKLIGGSILCLPGAGSPDGGM